MLFRAWWPKRLVDWFSLFLVVNRYLLWWQQLLWRFSWRVSYEYRGNDKYQIGAFLLKKAVFPMIVELPVTHFPSRDPMSKGCSTITWPIYELNSVLLAAGVRVSATKTGCIIPRTLQRLLPVLTCQHDPLARWKLCKEISIPTPHPPHYKYFTKYIYGLYRSWVWNICF